MFSLWYSPAMLFNLVNKVCSTSKPHTVLQHWAGCTPGLEIKMFCTCTEKIIDRCIQTHKGCKILHYCVMPAGAFIPLLLVCWSFHVLEHIFRHCGQQDPCQHCPGPGTASALCSFRERKWDIYLHMPQRPSYRKHQCCKAWQVSKKKIHSVRTRLLRGLGYFFSAFTPYRQRCQLRSSGLH